MSFKSGFESRVAV